MRNIATLQDAKNQKKNLKKIGRGRMFTAALA